MNKFYFDHLLSKDIMFLKYHFALSIKLQHVYQFKKI